MDCKECKTEVVSVPYAAFESTNIRNQKTIRGLIITLIVAVVMMFAEVGVFVWLWSQYDYAEVQVEADQSNADSNTVNVVNGDGTIE